MTHHTCSECKFFCPGAPGSEAMGSCPHRLYKSLYCGTEACHELNLKPLYKPLQNT